MPASVQSPADIVNLALARIGYKRRIGSLFDGSEAAQHALTVYAQTRDELLRQYDWGFAEQSVALTLLKSAPPGGYIPPLVWSAAYPPLPYLYEYAYPADCLKVRSLLAQPLFLFNPDPQPNQFSVGNDAAVKVILCNVPSAILVYTGQVTNPTEYEADFVEAFASALGRRMAPTLVGMDPTKVAAADEQAAKHTAEEQEG